METCDIKRTMKIPLRGRRPMVSLLLLVLSGTPILAQQDFFHPELSWSTIETEHFLVHYHEGAERTGKAIAKIAEEIYKPVTSLYNHEPDQKVSFIVYDVDDISNGAAYFYDNKIEIYAPSTDFVLRGTHNWLRNVVTHEFTHIVQIQTAMKFGRTVPAFYLQMLGYESERRPDVLYGYPNIIASYPISGFVVPVWFAEGVAQYNRKELRYDFWDSHRDMILRSYVLDGNMLTWKEMGVFGKTSLGNESSYNAGFAFVSYIGRTYGDEKLNEISRNLSLLDAVSIDGAIERSIGKSGSDVYDDWKKDLERTYAERVAPIRSHVVEGTLMDFVQDSEDGDDVLTSIPAAGIAGVANSIRPHQISPCYRLAAETGFANLFPRFSPDGKKVAFVSTGSSDYLGGSSLVVANLASKELTGIQRQVTTDVSWSPDGTRLYYGRSTRHNPRWSYQSDLYEYDLRQKRETRLTFGMRASSPAVSPDGKSIAFVVTTDGMSNLATCNVDGTDIWLLTHFKDGEQAYDPEWSSDSKRIAFDYSVKDGRDIAWVERDGSDLRFIITGPDDSRSATFTLDGRSLIFSSDRTGIFNLYSYNLQTEMIDQKSNVLGGAFTPAINADGKIVYAAYTSKGYKLYELDDPEVIPEGVHQYLPVATLESTGSTEVLASKDGENYVPQFDWHMLRTYDDAQLPAFQPKPYKSKFTSLTVVPFLRLDNYNATNTVIENFKPGVYLLANDVLDRTGIFAGIALNKNLERDLFAQFIYRGKLPGFYQLGLSPSAAAEIYNVTRKTESFITLPLDTLNVGITYNLLEFDFVLSQDLLPPWPNIEFRYIHSRYTSEVGSFTLPNPDRLVTASSDLYLIGNSFTLTLDQSFVQRSRDQEINPVGRKVRLLFTRELNKFNGDGDYEVSSTGLVPKYKNVNFTRAELSWKEYIPFLFEKHTLTFSVRGSMIFGPRVDSFFDSYVGGLIGMKGYPFYSLGGNEALVAGLTYRFPLFDNIDTRILHLYLDKLYASIYTDVGDAWTGKISAGKNFKTDAGFELRLEAFSWYSYPTRIFFNASYGLDQFSTFIRTRNTTVTYGKEWRLYFGMTFGFDFD